MIWQIDKKSMPLNRLGMVLQQAGFQSKRIGKARTRDGWFAKEVWKRSTQTAI